MLKKMIALDAELHTDQEVKLLKQGSLQKNLWEINLYPEFFGTKNFVGFDSMINLRPSQNNRSRGVENLEIRNKIVKIVKNKIIK